MDFYLFSSYRIDLQTNLTGPSTSETFKKDSVLTSTSRGRDVSCSERSTLLDSSTASSSCSL